MSVRESYIRFSATHSQMGSCFVLHDRRVLPGTPFSEVPTSNGHSDQFCQSLDEHQSCAGLRQARLGFEQSPEKSSTMVDPAGAAGGEFYVVSILDRQ